LPSVGKCRLGGKGCQIKVLTFLWMNEEVIVLVDTQHGKDYELKHYVRRPKTSEFKEYRRRMSEFRGGLRRFKWEDRTIDAAEWLYRKIIQRVEGYTLSVYGNKDVMNVTKEELEELGQKRNEKYESWVDLIPPRHKVFVVDKVAGFLVEGEAEMEEQLGEFSSEA